MRLLLPSLAVLVSLFAMPAEAEEREFQPGDADIQYWVAVNEGHTPTITPQIRLSYEQFVPAGFAKQTKIKKPRFQLYNPLNE